MTPLARRLAGYSLAQITDMLDRYEHGDGIDRGDNRGCQNDLFWLERELESRCRTYRRPGVAADEAGRLLARCRAVSAGL